MTSNTRNGEIQGSPRERPLRSCPFSILLVSWGLILQGIGLVIVLVALVFCACAHFAEVADEFLGLVMLLLLGAGAALLAGFKLRQGRAWARTLLLWVFPVPVLDGFIEGTRAPPLLMMLAAQYLVYLYVLTNPAVLHCFRPQR